MFGGRLTLAKVVAAALYYYQSPSSLFHRSVHPVIRAQEPRLGLGRAPASLRRFNSEGRVERVAWESPNGLALDQAALGVAAASICLRKTGRSVEPPSADEPLLALEELRQQYLQARSGNPHPYNDPDLLSVLWIAFALRGWLPNFPQHVGEVELMGQLAFYFQWQASGILSKAAWL